MNSVKLCSTCGEVMTRQNSAKGQLAVSKTNRRCRECTQMKQDPAGMQKQYDGDWQLIKKEKPIRTKQSGSRRGRSKGHNGRRKGDVSHIQRTAPKEQPTAKNSSNSPPTTEQELLPSLVADTPTSGVSAKTPLLDPKNIWVKRAQERTSQVTQQSSLPGQGIDSSAQSQSRGERQNVNSSSTPTRSSPEVSRDEERVVELAQNRADRTRQANESESPPSDPKAMPTKFQFHEKQAEEAQDTVSDDSSEIDEDPLKEGDVISSTHAIDPGAASLEQAQLPTSVELVNPWVRRAEEMKRRAQEKRENTQDSAPNAKNIAGAGTTKPKPRKRNSERRKGRGQATGDGGGWTVVQGKKKR